MKKKWVFIFIVFILIVSLYFLISIKPIHAEDVGVGEVVPGISPESLQKVQTGIEKLSEEQARKQFLSQNWSSILQNSTFYKKFIKPIVNEYDKMRPFVDPIFTYTIGMTSNVSWVFVLTLVIWITCVVYIYIVVDYIPIFSHNTMRIISIGFIIIFSVLRISKTIAEQTVNVISKYDTTTQLIAIVVIIVFFILASIFSKTLTEIFDRLTGRKEKKEVEKYKTKLKQDAEIADAFTGAATGRDEAASILRNWLNKK